MNDELIERLRTTEQMLNVAHFKEAESLIREARDVIEELQSKQPERKKGKWDLFIQCSACGYKRKWNGEIFGFCPNCGTDMREEIDNA